MTSAFVFSHIIAKLIRCSDVIDCLGSWVAQNQKGKLKVFNGSHTQSSQLSISAK